MSLSGNKPQITSGALISSSFVSDIYDALDGTTAEPILLTGATNITNLSATGSLLGSASFSESSSIAISSSYSEFAESSTSASYSEFAVTASFAHTASYALVTETHVETSSSYAETALSASYAATASYVLNQPLVYKAIINQSGTDAPTVVNVLENTIGNIVWSRDDVGQYLGTLAGVFTQNKTHIIPPCKKLLASAAPSTDEIAAGRNDTDSIYISTGYRNNSTGVMTISDDVLFGEDVVTILVYP